jgi:hypothetical protein
MEKIQERALRFITDDYKSSLSVLLKTTNTELLHIKRIQLITGEAYKILNKESPAYLQNLLSLKKSHYDTRRERQAFVPRVNSTRYGLKSFRYEATRIWNSLPNNIRKAESYGSFRRLLQRWDGQLCSCRLCEYQ